jgi:hypothetical protein
MKKDVIDIKTVVSVKDKLKMIENCVSALSTFYRVNKTQEETSKLTTLLDAIDDLENTVKKEITLNDLK